MESINCLSCCSHIWLYFASECDSRWSPNWHKARLLEGTTCLSLYLPGHCIYLTSWCTPGSIRLYYHLSGPQKQACSVVLHSGMRFFPSSEQSLPFWYFEGLQKPGFSPDLLTVTNYSPLFFFLILIWVYSFCHLWFFFMFVFFWFKCFDRFVNSPAFT